MDVCLRVLMESNKSRFDGYSVENSTFRDCRVHIFSDNLSWTRGTAYSKANLINWSTRDTLNISIHESQAKLPTIAWDSHTEEDYKGVQIVIYSQWTVAKQRPGTQEISYGTCKSAGEKAIGLGQDKRKSRGGGRVKQTNLRAKRV